MVAPSALLPKKKKSPISTFLLFASFALVILILFNPGLNRAMGDAAGVVLNPVIGFDHELLMLTIFLASIILVIATTAIRHFLVDWTSMARVQEAMRTFQKEFSDARKSNNTYKMKKLTEAQPEVMALQAEMSTAQMKPMAFTMILVIPIFAWLGAFVGTPVAYSLDDAPPQPIGFVQMDLLDPIEGHIAWPAGATESSTFHQSRDLVAYAFVPPGGTAPTSGAFMLVNGKSDARTTISYADAPVVPESSRIGEYPAGVATFRVTGSNLTLTTTTEAHGVGRVAILFMADGRPLTVSVLDDQGKPKGDASPLAIVGTDPVKVNIPAAASAYVIVPQEYANGAAVGQLTLDAGGHPAIVDPSAVIRVHDATRLQPFETKVPWNEHWSLLEAGYPLAAYPGFLALPHWILLYSLFGIPFGQIAQRALKLWEYRHHDLDGDGKTPAESV